MKNQSVESMEKGFCTFCMGAYDPLRIGAHVRRCPARKDDADCAQLNGREHPMAFLLMIGIEGRPVAWLCLEAHSRARLSDLELFIRHVWFPATEAEGDFLFPQRMLRNRIPENADKNLRLEQFLRVKDRFCLQVMKGKSVFRVNLEVIGHLPAAILHRPVDLAAFPLDSDGGRHPGGESLQ